MKAHNFKLVVAAFLVAGSLGAVSAHAEGIYAGGSLGMQLYQDSLNGISGHGSGLSGNLFGGYQVPPNFALVEGVADLGHNDGAVGKLDDRSEDINAVSTAPTNDEGALLATFAAAHVNLDISGADSSGTTPQMALGPQYSLNSKVTLGGTWEGHGPIAFGAHPDNEAYTFGVRVTF